MTMITPSYLGETIEYSSLHACRSTLEDPTCPGRVLARLHLWGAEPDQEPETPKPDPEEEQGPLPAPACEKSAPRSQKRKRTQPPKPR